MLKSVIEVLKDCFLRLKPVNSFVYISDDLVRCQGNQRNYEVAVDDMTLSQLNITDNTFVMKLEISVLSHVDEEQTILDVQDTAYTAACTVVEALDTYPDYKGVLRVHDYSIATVSHMTDDDAAGVRLSLTLKVPNPADLCGDVWGDKPDEPADHEIELNPITLPKKKLC